MSWNLLEKSFSTLRNVDTKDGASQRNLITKKNGKNTGKSALTKLRSCSRKSLNKSLKRNKPKVINHTMLLKTVYSSEDEDDIDFDPDLSSNCNGCSQKKVSEPLYFYNENKTCSTQRKINSPQLTSPLRNIENLNLQSKSQTLFPNTSSIKEASNIHVEEFTQEGATFQNRKSIECTKINQKLGYWCTLQNSFGNLMDNDIFESDSDNDNSISNESLIVKQLENKKRLNVEKDMCIPRRMEYKNDDLNSLVIDIENQNKREKQIRVRKGGLLEILRKSLNRSASDHIFWKHERKLELNDRGIVAVVKKKLKQFGVLILTLEMNGKSVDIIFRSDPENEYMPIDSSLEICPSSNLYHIGNQQVFLAIHKYMRKY